MTITRIGANKKYSDNWESIFGGKKSAQKAKSSSHGKGAKSAKKKVAAKKAKPSKSAGGKKKASRRK